ncbi:MAG: methyltransferase domain-containing protein [Acidobacteriota bacterium]
MKESLLEFLQCPICRDGFQVITDEDRAGEILAGVLQCLGCAVTFPVKGGIPRFVNVSSIEQSATARNFGAQWLTFDQIGPHHEVQFLDWIYPITPEFVRGKVVLEAGCGKGRHTHLVSTWGARAVIGVDLSEAVDAAYRNTLDQPNVHIIQADIYQLPFKPMFDYAFSVGVLHHLPDPKLAFLALAALLRPGGSISSWVYGRENNGWLIHLVNPLRRNLTSRLPFRMLYHLSYIPTVILYSILKLGYRPLEASGIARKTFYGEYLTYISRFPFREIHNIVHDHLTAPIAHYISREEFAEWFQEARADGIEISWHNRNSWRGLGRIVTHHEAVNAQ